MEYINEIVKAIQEFMGNDSLTEREIHDWANSHWNDEETNSYNLREFLDDYQWKCFNIGDEVYLEDAVSGGEYKVTKISNECILTISNGTTEQEVECGDVLKKSKVKCPKCGHDMYYETIGTDYEYYCAECDEAFFGFEIKGIKEGRVMP